jgi:anthranilate phosphoribosyltransferase
VIEVRQGALRELVLTPEGLAVPRASLETLRGGDATYNAALARALLAGQASAVRDLVVVNAGCAIYVADQATTMAEGLTRAREALASGAAKRLLERVREFCDAR